MNGLRLSVDMVSRIVATAVVVSITGFFAGSATAASFDCAKAGTKAEKFICESEAISKLDDELATTYRVVLEKADAAGKQRLIVEQRHWITHTRAPCRDETCFTLAYWARQSELATWFEPKSPLYAKESDKAEAIKKVLATARLHKGWTGERPQCDRLLADLKQMNGIRFVDPVAQAMSYEDPVLDPWKKNCGGKRPLHFSWACEPRLIAIDPSEIENALVNGQCEGGFGLPPFKVFELPPLKPKDKTRYLLYAASSYAPVNQEWKKPRIGGGYSSGFQEFKVDSCTQPKKGVEVTIRDNQRDDPSYDMIFEYGRRYFVMVLERSYSGYRLDVDATDRNESCWWTPVEK